MTDLFDYLLWRGDILFSQLPLNPVDALIFSILSYLRWGEVVPGSSEEQVTLSQAAATLLALPDAESRARVKTDLELLLAASQTPRFSQVSLSFYQDVFVPEEETQFAAVTFYPDDGSAVLAFRGTDRTLVGWKEDFNMSFRESVPAQRKAVEYVRTFAGASQRPMVLTGHSKGGNLAVYAAAKSSEANQARILAVYNQDGPGFTQNLMGDPGYLRMVPKIHTYVPQSSVIGMLMEREEPCAVIRSNQIAVMQHDPYSWEVLGKDFVHVQELTADSRFLSRTFKSWLAGMTPQARGDFFDAVFALLATGTASRTNEILQLKNVRAYLKTLVADEEMRSVIASELAQLLRAARSQTKKSDILENGS